VLLYVASWWRAIWKERKEGQITQWGHKKLFWNAACLKKSSLFFWILCPKTERGYFLQRGSLKVERSCFCTTFVEHLVDKRFLCVSQKLPTKKKQTNKLKSPQHKNRKANQR
jgi:hypothetical protein